MPEFDVMVGGFPCQAFSLAGYRQGFDDEKGRGTLFFEMMRIIRERKQPDTNPKLYSLKMSRTIRISGISYKNKGSQRNGVRKCTTESALTKSKTVFPSDDSLLKMLYLATMDITKKWTGRRRDWSQIRAQLEIYFEERLEKAEF